MTEYLTFLLLGLGAGAVYAMLSLGLVLTVPGLGAHQLRLRRDGDVSDVRVGDFPLQSAGLVAPNSYFFIGGPPAGVPVQAQFIAEQLKAKRVAVIHANDPAATQLARSFYMNVLKDRGVQYKEFSVPVATADWAPVLSTRRWGFRTS